MSQNHSFRIDLPPGWQDATTHYFMGPEDRGQQHAMTLNIDEAPHTKDAEQYADDHIENLLSSMTNTEMLKRAPREMPDGGTAIEAVIKMQASDKPVFQKMVFVLRDGKAYVFKAAFTKMTLKTIGLQFNLMVDSFLCGDAARGS